MKNGLTNKFTREEQFFIRVLKNFIHEEATESDPSLDWKLIKEYADRHQVSAIFYKQTKNEIFQGSYASLCVRLVFSVSQKFFVVA